MVDKTLDQYIICKIGGALLTDKSKLASPNYDMILQYGRQLKSLPKEFKKKLIVVVGGGSFGNAMSHSSPAKVITLEEVSLLVNEWANIVCNIWETLGICLKKIRVQDIFKNPNNCGFKFHEKAVIDALQFDYLPVIFGGVLSTSKRIRLVSSDVIPLFIAKKMLIYRVIALTNVEGVFLNGRLISKINDLNKDDVLKSVSGSLQPDSTGGMKYKVMAMIKITSENTHCVICSGIEVNNFAKAIMSNTPPGTLLSK